MYIQASCSTIPTWNVISLPAFINSYATHRPSHALRHCSKLMAAAYYAISVGRSDGDAVTDSFKDGVIHTVWVDVLAFGKAIGMVMFDEKADAKGVITAVCNNPLDIYLEQ